MALMTQMKTGLSVKSVKSVAQFRNSCRTLPGIYSETPYVVSYSERLAIPLSSLCPLVFFCGHFIFASSCVFSRLFIP